MQQLPLGIQDFRKIRKQNLLYIDKTKFIYELLEVGEVYFLSRPRRFGKSLLISTFAELFLGSKELFQGLWIAQHYTAWQTYPVIQLDFSRLGYKRRDLSSSIGNYLDKIARQNGIEAPQTADNGEKLADMIELLAAKHQKGVVLLVDEYDKPIIDHLENTAQADENREVLQNLFSTLKTVGKYLRFLFITGVSKFSRVSVFSTLNNLTDLSLSPKAALLTGVSQAEFQQYFPLYLQQLAIQKKQTIAFLKRKIKTWYNGYSWDGQHFVYNPFSLLSLFFHQQFDNYWFETGTPTFLAKKVKEQGFEIAELNNLKMEKGFNVFNIHYIDSIPLLFQTGYLTLKKATETGYTLAFPNQEVQQSFYRHLLPLYVRAPLSKTIAIRHKIAKSLGKKNIKGFVESLNQFFETIPYQLSSEQGEKYFHSIILLALHLLGIDIEAEVQTRLGRIDALVKTQSYIYIIEFKMGKAKTALAQIHDRQYYAPYLGGKKNVVLLGIGIDVAKRKIGEWEVEVLK